MKDCEGNELGVGHKVAMCQKAFPDNKYDLYIGTIESFTREMVRVRVPHILSWRNSEPEPSLLLKSPHKLARVV